MGKFTAHEGMYVSGDVKYRPSGFFDRIFDAFMTIFSFLSRGSTEYIGFVTVIVAAMIAFAPLLTTLCSGPYVSRKGAADMEVKLVSGCKLSPYPDDIPEGASLKAFPSLYKGNTVTILAYNHEIIDEKVPTFQVRTAKGDIGFIPVSAVKGEFVHQMSKEDTTQIDETMHELALLVPEYKDGFYVGRKWVDKKIKVGETTKSQIDSAWWGYEQARVNTSKNSFTSYYPIDIREGKSDRNMTLAVDFKDGVVSAVNTVYDVHKKGNFIGRTYIADFIFDTDIFARGQGNITSRPCDFEGQFQPKGILKFILLIVVVVVFLFWIVLQFLSVTLLPPLLLHKLGDIKFFPGFLLKPILICAQLYGVVVYYNLYGAEAWGFITRFNLIFTIIILVLGFKVAYSWNYWCNYNHCPKCNTLYSLELYDSNTRTTKYLRFQGNVEVGKTDITVGSDYVTCLNCEEYFKIGVYEERNYK